jgi:alkanesulfonate monooxygenase SsuD/methylene tetrahydromethanopterin reductase-like flavin-dependent oxidoreductase (luciferase family)
MPEKVRFGIFRPQLYPWPRMKQEADKIETLGFDSLWIADHFVSPYSTTADWFECWALLGALAASTERIRLGTGVTHVVYRNPAILARSALTVDHISNGRLDFGMGVGGGGDYNFAMTGTPAQSTRERVDRWTSLSNMRK